jgi:phosphatidylglycerophosphatase C
MGTPEAERQPGPLLEGAGGRPIVAFDFDGTLTEHDSFTAFLRWKAEPYRYFVGVLRLFPRLLAYLFNRDRGRLKAAAAARFLGGTPIEQLQTEAEAFAMQKAQSMLRPDAVQAWRNWRGQGVQLVIVTATPETIVRPFARALGADMLIGTRLELDEDGRVTGRFIGPNCRGPEKVARLKEAFGEDVTLWAAYGDTSGDREMLRLAEIPGYRVFKGKPFA